MSAHPRSRGENTASFFGSADTLGSSPLTRGKLLLDEDLGEGARLIPAHAGKTSHHLPARERGSAHPRSRGENAGRTGRGGPGWGSSPLTRGKPWCKPCLPRHVGLIPAHAGKTLMVAISTATRPAHPRSRGENGSAPSIISVRSGSSPLTRGKPDPYSYAAVKRGLIPAHAGKTVLVHAPASYGAAHPRSRGENFAGLKDKLSSAGSSPLTRGKPVLTPPLIALVRLIPAHAGKTPLRRRHRGREAAHPRSRGENWTNSTTLE